MEWRLSLFGSMFDDNRPNAVPVSFLMARYDHEFTHEVAVEVVKEFLRVARVAVSSDEIIGAMRSAETKFAHVRQAEDEPLLGWFASSDVQDAAAIRASGSEYAVRVDISEWPAEDYVREQGACRVIVYFVYLPPDKQVDLSKVTGGGF
jgi:hypothetical protein